MIPCENLFPVSFHCNYTRTDIGIIDRNSLILCPNVALLEELDHEDAEVGQLMENRLGWVGGAGGRHRHQLVIAGRQACLLLTSRGGDLAKKK